MTSATTTRVGAGAGHVGATPIPEVGPARTPSQADGVLGRKSGVEEHQPPLVIADIYHTHVRGLYNFIYVRVGNREAAEDLTSHIFLTALTHLDLTRAEQSIAAWLYRVARNAVADYWRRTQRVRLVALEDAQVPWRPQPAQDGARQAQAAARATALLGRLPENYRTVLGHRLLEGLSVAETAERMGTSAANVKVLQHRALKRAAQLRDEDDERADG